MLIESNTQKFLEFIFKYPTKGFTLREIAREIKISPPTASKISKELEERGLIEVKKERVQYKVFGNFNNDSFKNLKKIYNLFSLTELIEFLEKTLNPDFITVFGSYAKGEDMEQSDIDLFIDARPSKEIDLKKFEKNLGRKIHLQVGSFKKLPKELKNNIINGVILQGVLEC